MPDENGKLLPPIEDKCFDGDKQSVELKFEKCKHAFNFTSPNELRCIKCGVAYSGTVSELIEIKKLLDKQI